MERLNRGDKLRIVVAHRDRLARFGFELIRWMAEQNGGEIVVLGNTDYSPEQELTKDILAILHTFPPEADERQLAKKYRTHDYAVG